MNFSLIITKKEKKEYLFIILIKKIYMKILKL